MLKPNAAEVLAGTGKEGAAPAAAAPEAVYTIGGQPHVVSYPGLSASSSYVAYCAQGDLVSEWVQFTTSHTIHVHPVVSEITAESVVFSTTFSGTGDARCVVLAENATAPRAQDVMDGAGRFGASAAASAPPAGVATGGEPFVVTYPVGGLPACC